MMDRQWRIWQVRQRIRVAEKGDLLGELASNRLTQRLDGKTRPSEENKDSDRKIDCLCAILELRNSESINCREVGFLEDWLLRNLPDITSSQIEPFDDVESLKKKLGTKVHAQLLITDIVKSKPLLATQELREIAKLWLIDDRTPNWDHLTSHAAKIKVAWEALDSLVPEQYRIFPDHQTLRNESRRNQTIDITR